MQAQKEYKEKYLKSYASVRAVPERPQQATPVPLEG